MKALVLSGGGAKGAFQVGVLRRWIEKFPELDYDLFAGTSAGAINAAALASLRAHMPMKDAIDQLEKFWRNDVRKNSDVYHFWPFMVPMFWKDSVYDTTPLADMLKARLGGASRPCRVAATNISTGDLVYFSERHPEFWKCVLASASFPIFFPSVRVDGQDYGDGAQVHNIPIGQVIRDGATEIHMVAASNPYEKYQWNGKRNLFSLVSRTLDIMTEQMSKSDLEITGFKNDLSDLSDVWNKVTVQTIFFSGAQKYDALDFDGRKIDEIIDAGYMQAMDAVVVD